MATVDAITCQHCGKATGDDACMMTYKLNNEPTCMVACNIDCWLQFRLLMDEYKGFGCALCGKQKTGKKWIPGTVTLNDGGYLGCTFCSIPCRIKMQKLCGNKKRCNFCGKHIEHISKCSLCREAAYCSEECQKFDWSRDHKEMCKILRNGRKTTCTESTKYTCANCSKQSTKEFERCSQCKKVHYCSEKCQKLHWKKEHKAVCKKD
jgi:hypothetical protein